MDDNTLLLRVVQAFVLGATIIGVSMAGCTVHNNQAISDAIASGADPIKVHCAAAIEPDRAICALAAAR